MGRTGRIDARIGGTAAAAGAVGYLPLALGGALLVGYPVGEGGIAPDLVTAVALAGIVSPAVFGACGGALGGVLGNRE